MKRSNAVARAAGILSCLVTGLVFMSYDAPVASAQVLYGSIVGSVTDQTNAVVPKTLVKVTNPSTGLSREATTDTAGYYSIPNLPQGTYDLSVSATGFKPVTQKSVDILINNAGTNVPQAIDAITDAEWDRIMEINLNSVMALNVSGAKSLVVLIRPILFAPGSVYQSAPSSGPVVMP